MFDTNGSHQRNLDRALCFLDFDMDGAWQYPSRDHLFLTAKILSECPATFLLDISFCVYAFCMY